MQSYKVNWQTVLIYYSGYSTIIGLDITTVNENDYKHYSKSI